MNQEFQKAIIRAIRQAPSFKSLIESLESIPGGGGTIRYNRDAVGIAPRTPGFTDSSTRITDEELVRAYLLTQLVDAHGYAPDSAILQIECPYKPVGRPVGKGGRIDVVVRHPLKGGNAGSVFLFIECKAPDKYDADLRLIDGQLFRLSRQEDPRPRHLVYYAADIGGAPIRERILVVDTDAFPSFESWDQAGQPIVDRIPARYGRAVKSLYANVPARTTSHEPLDRSVGAETFSRLRNEIHDVIWGGGGTNNNEVFVNVVRVILCKIYDEKETPPGAAYQFQRRGDALEPEEPDALVARLNSLYRLAEDAYLALPKPSPGPAFDTSRISSDKLAYVVGRLESVSLTENNHPGDLLGEFFEQIVSQDFTQTKGQFFTHIKLVTFMLHLASVDDVAQDTLQNQRDHLGRPRLPYVIDPSCGSGTFLIEYMKLISASVGAESRRKQLPPRVREEHESWFASGRRNAWAREYLFGIENNYDLGLAAKVNMVLHGDGSMNTWIASGLLPFEAYWVEGRTNILGAAKARGDSEYEGLRNEQFDLVLSNPPFSLKLSPDERERIRDTFVAAPVSRSETLFVERWYQLLRSGGRFCCILPEAVLDTSTYEDIRMLLISRFRLDAVVSLPYVSFKPFTSTKTCIVLATKRTESDVAAFEAALDTARREPLHGRDLLAKVLDRLGWADTPIFMAEPGSVGYKRRKNLPDLPQPNDLFPEDREGRLAQLNTTAPTTVLEAYRAGTSARASSTLGFFTSLRAAVTRDGIRLDPKYRWLWDFRGGVVLGSPESAKPLSDLCRLTTLPRREKGDLDQETVLIDLAEVETRQAFLRSELPVIDYVGSDKWQLVGADLYISKLEPYLGKVLMDPPEGAIGSTEWVGLLVRPEYPREFVAYLLMLPAMCEAYRRLQSGKRHARFDADEFLQLRVEVPSPDSVQSIQTVVQKLRHRIETLRSEEIATRSEIDSLYPDSAPA